MLIQHPAKKERKKPLDPFGLCLHTSGRGIVKRAIKKGVEPIELALDWYSRKGSVHAVIDYNGDIYQLQHWDVRGAHVGVTWLQRRRYLSGSWERQVHSTPLYLWKKRWRGFKSPQHLYPTKGPNSSYIGVEMIPLSQKRPNGLWFTDAQHRAARELWVHFKVFKFRWDDKPNRLVGHEDLSITRWQSSGGWDPGGMRERPRFDWKRISS